MSLVIPEEEGLVWGVGVRTTDLRVSAGENGVRGMSSRESRKLPFVGLRGYLLEPVVLTCLESQQKDNKHQCAYVCMYVC